MREVPTSTPMPMVEMSRSWDWEREKESGREPARKDLGDVSSVESQDSSIIGKEMEGTYARAINVLRESNINNPSSILYWAL